MFLFYFICFACLYAGKIEYLYIDKKKGIIRKRLINIFLSKIEVVKYINLLKEIDMVLRGIKTYGNDENSPIFLKCKFPNRLELIKYMAKKNPKYKDLLNDVESDPNNYIKLCHDYYDDTNIE